jgi:hypothetical protein
MSTSERPYQFFEPLWRRVAVIVFVAAWLAIEVFYAREPMWIIIAAALLVYGFWVFIFKWPKSTPNG